MAKDLVHSERRGAVALLTMDNPATMNAMDEKLGPALCRALETAGRDRRVGAVVLTGAGGNFSGGGNLQNAAAHLEHNPGAGAGVVFAGYTVWVSRVLAAMTDLGKPVVAAAVGAASGAGLGWLLAADLVLAADDIRLPAGFLAVGLVPGAGVSLTLPRLAGLQACSEALMLNRGLSPRRAHELGLVDALLPAKDVLPSALALAAELAAGPAGAQASAKALLGAALHGDLLVQAEREREGVMAAADDAEFARRVERFGPRARRPL